MSVVEKNREMSDEMLVKYLVGETDGPEGELVKAWLNESSENRKYFYDFKMVWNVSGKIKPVSIINESEAWARFQQRVATSAAPLKKVPVRSTFDWIKVAAVLVFLAGSACITYNLSSSRDVKMQPVVQNTRNAEVGPIPLNANVPNSKKSEIADRDDRNRIAASSNMAGQRPVISEGRLDKKKHLKVLGRQSKEIFCNSTPCPIEICINQTMKCPNNKPAAISSYSTLEPDQSGELDYKAKDKIAKNCSLTVKDIEIKSVATGEMIILNEHSSPSTAQDLFNYITRRKKGDILAGKFHKDCDNRVSDHDLVFESNSGNWVLQ